MRTIEVFEAGPCAVLRINRPRALNALDDATLGALERVVAEVGGGPARAVILTGAGDRAFCAGADVSELGARDTEAVRAASRRGQALASRLESLPIPSIALLHGYALGGGLELALGCTFRLGTADTQLGFPEIRLGVCTGWGGTQRLPRLVGPQHALDLLMSGRLLSGQEAVDIGLLHSLVEGDRLEAAVAFAGRFTGQSLVALRYVREAVARAGDLPLAAGLAAESDLSALSYQSADAREGIAAFTEKRKPRFEDR